MNQEPNTECDENVLSQINSSHYTSEENYIIRKQIFNETVVCEMLFFSSLISAKHTFHLLEIIYFSFCILAPVQAGFTVQK